MTENEVEILIQETIARLPEWAQQALDNIEFLVLDAADEYLDPDQEGLLGLYIGVSLPERGSDYAGELPDVIYIFREPHLQLGLAPRELRAEIQKTLLHEIAHYFGIDDEHLDEIGWG